MTRFQQTVATYFRYSLMDLLNKMVAGTPHFVRCLKPNDLKEPGNFHTDRILTQLRYTGVLETTRIRRQGYSHRIAFSEFLKRYHILGFRHDEAVSVNGESCIRLLKNLGMTNWAIGKTKVFLKYYHVEELAQRYEDVCQKIIRVQSYIRMWLARSRFYKLRWKRDKASVMIQKHIRGFIVRKKYRALNKNRHDAAIKIQKVMRGRIARKKYQAMQVKRHQAAVCIQARVRGFLCRRRYQQLKLSKQQEQEGKQLELQDASARKIQRVYRMYRLKKRTNARLNRHKLEGVSATKIQAYFRMWRQRTVYKQILAARKKQESEIIISVRQVESYNNNSSDGQIQDSEDGQKYGDRQINDKDMMPGNGGRHGGDGQKHAGGQTQGERHIHGGDSQMNGNGGRQVNGDRGSQVNGDGGRHGGGGDQTRREEPVHSGGGKVNSDENLNGDGGSHGGGKMQGFGLKNALMHKIPGGGMFGNGQPRDDDRQIHGNEQLQKERQVHYDEQSLAGGQENSNQQSQAKAQIQAGGLKSAMRQIIPNAPSYGANQAADEGHGQGSSSNQQPKASTAVSAFNDSIKKKAAKSASDSPSKKVWEKVSQQAVGETRIEQMKKMHTEKTVMSDEDASYYDSVNADDTAEVKTNPEVVINGEDEDDYRDYDMDEEVMSFMHSHIHNSEPTENTVNNNQSKPDSKDEGEDIVLPNDIYQANRYQSDSLAWDAPLLTARENALHPDDYNENISGRISRHSEYSIEADLQTERDNFLEEDDATELAKRLESELQGSILGLWQQRLNQTTYEEGDIEIIYASESEMNSTGPPSPIGDDPSVISPPVQFSDNSVSQMDLNGNRSSNLAPVKLPIALSNDTNSGAALEEIRARLRKTKFDYSSDTRQRISEATPQLDFRNVLKKKGKA